MKQYTKNNERKYASEIVIRKDGMQILAPTEDMILEDGWVEYVEPEKTEEQKLYMAKSSMKRRLKNYDESSLVNIFTIGGTKVWLDKATRAGLMLRFQAEIAKGKENTTLWHEGKQFPLLTSVALQMLYALELYASECYDNTQSHYAAIDALTTVEEVEAYDFTVGYPEKLRF